jgi:molybdenum cofactor cytidylyltransferase
VSFRELVSGRVPDQRFVGVLLAAGQGRRFDTSGAQNKLLQRLPNGDTVAAASAKNLRAAMATVLAVIPPMAAASVLATEIAAAGCTWTVCNDSAFGMGATISHAVRTTGDASGWVIALADMPFVRPETIAQLVRALVDGADIAAPVYQGIRGNPVAFGRRHFDALVALSGEVGARRLLDTCPVMEIGVDDPGIRIDIDTPCDLAGIMSGKTLDDSGGHATKT